VGINNHMGSKFTADRSAMAALLKLIAARKLLFIDSATTANSVAMSSAAELGVPAARRDLFLDNVQEKAAIISQLRDLASMAKKRGRALAIGHPYKETLTALREFGPELTREVNVVSITEYMAQPEH